MRTFIVSMKTDATAGGGPQLCAMDVTLVASSAGSDRRRAHVEDSRNLFWRNEPGP
jgi:hypothetical protein